MTMLAEWQQLRLSLPLADTNNVQAKQYRDGMVRIVKDYFPDAQDLSMFVIDVWGGLWNWDEKYGNAIVRTLADALPAEAVMGIIA